jgi:hypothetical protein
MSSRRHFSACSVYFICACDSVGRARYPSRRGASSFFLSLCTLECINNFVTHANRRRSGNWVKLFRGAMLSELYRPRGGYNNWQESGSCQQGLVCCYLLLFGCVHLCCLRISVLCAAGCDVVHKHGIDGTKDNIKHVRGKALARCFLWCGNDALFLNGERARVSNLQMRNLSKQTVWCNVSYFGLTQFNFEKSCCCSVCISRTPASNYKSGTTLNL